MIKLQTKHGCCWVEPDYVKAIYPLESEIAFSESGLAEVKCYAALENGETLELLEPTEAVYERWAAGRKEIPIEPGNLTKRNGKAPRNQKENDEAT